MPWSRHSSYVRKEKMMRLPITISFKNMKPSPWLEQEVRNRVEKLDEFCDEIMRCRVVIDIPHKHHHQGNFHRIRIALTVPNKQIVVSREAPEHSSAEDVRAVLRDAFDALRRQLQDYVRVRQRIVKTHAERPCGRITKLFPEGYGFIQTSDGRDVYFHSNSVINHNFADLQVGAEVVFAEEQGEQGPQASTVRLLERQGSIAS
jgi:cold shock CspA family protein/ribosome-associated translation inhibitor RaiA